MTPTQLVVLAGVLCAVALASTALLVVSVRRSARSRQQLAAQLDHSRQEVSELARAVAGLARQVESAQRSGAADREYVITTLAEAADVAELGSDPGRPLAQPVIRPVTGAALVEVLEEQAVGRLAEVDTSRPWGARLADAGVRALALGHGVRRALSEENRDRAAAEAHVARRRSRRTRRQEVREARRLLRALRAQQAQQAQQGVRSAEDAA